MISIGFEYQRGHCIACEQMSAAYQTQYCVQCSQMGAIIAAMFSHDNNLLESREKKTEEMTPNT